DDEETSGRKETAVRLMGWQKRLLDDETDVPRPKKGGDDPLPKVPDLEDEPKDTPSKGSKYYIAKPGFANYYFNKQAQTQLLDNLKKTGDFSKLAGAWKLEGSIKFARTNTGSPFILDMANEKAKVGTGTEAVVRLKLGDVA